MRSAHAVWFGILFATGLAIAGPRDAPDRGIETRLEGAVVEAARSRFGLDLQSEEPLRRAAREFCLVRAAGHEVDPNEFLRQSLSQVGVLDPFPYVFYGSAPVQHVDAFVARLLSGFEQLPGRERRFYTHVAAGVVTRSERRRVFFRERTAWVVVLLTQRAISFSPLPDSPAPGDRVVFEGEVHAPFRAPEVLLTRPDGGVTTLANLTSEARQFRTWLRFDAGAGEYQLEVVGRDDMGPRVLGLCSLHAHGPGEVSAHERLMVAARSGTLAAPAVQRSAGPDPGSQTDDEAEAHLLELVNRDRRRAGVRPLLADETLGRMARAHSRDMAENDFFAHISPQTGRLAERAARVSLQYRRLAENIALHRDVDEAEAALLRSPGHRVNLLDPEFTHLGVGVAFATDHDGNRRVYVTQNFMVPAVAVGP